MSATNGDWAEVVERLKAAIVRQFGTLAAFARKLEMDPTQLSATLRPHRRPEPETLDRFSAALGWEPNVLREWYGYSVPQGDEPEPARLVVVSDKRFDPARVIAFVESHPDPDFVAQLMAAKQRRAPESYARLCFRIFRAWTSNAELAMDVLEMAERD